MKTLNKDELKLKIEREVIETALKECTSPKFDWTYTKEMKELAFANFQSNLISNIFQLKENEWL